MTKREREKLMKGIKQTANSVPPADPASEPASVSMRKNGPKDKYDDLRILDRLDDIEEMYREGNSDTEVAYRLGVSVRTIYNWLNRGIGDVDPVSTFGQILGEPAQPAPEPEMEKYIPFIEARKKGREPSNARLENTAYALANGDFEGEFVSVGWDEGIAKEYRYKKKLDPNAQMIWRLLLNRMPEKYRDKVEVAHTGSMDATLRLLGNVPADQLALLKQWANSSMNAQLAQQTHPSIDVEEDETPIDDVGDSDD